MLNLAIVGAGQIGSRHLQALTQLEGKVNIQLVSPSVQSLENCRKRLLEISTEIPRDKVITYHKTIDDLRDAMDIVIVSTCSDVRAQVIKDLIEKRIIKNFIFEKILFQKVGDYFYIDQLLKEKNIPAWTNCYMRATDFFKEFKKNINPKKEIQMLVTGSRWNMATTSIHFIDLFSFLTDAVDLVFSNNQLENSVAESKRPGFKEIFGKLKGKNLKGDKLSLTCQRNGDLPARVQIINGENIHEITFLENEIIQENFFGDERIVKKIPVILQSNLTHHFVSQIVKDKSCDLATYQDSMKLHLPFIEVLLEHLRAITKEKVVLCPIT